MLLLASCNIAWAQTAPTTETKQPVTIIRAGTLIDGKSDQPKTNQVIVIRGNHIESVGASAGQGLRADLTIDLSRATVLPGLIDTHTHMFLQGEDPAEGGYDDQLLKHGLAYRAARATASARRALEQGFTTIRDVETEGAGYGDVGIKQAVNEGRIPGPRFSHQPALSPPLEAIPSKATLRRSTFPKARRLWTGQSRPAKQPASKSTTAPIGSRST